MQLTHIALWTTDLERSRTFYITWFNGKSNEKYVNPTKGFASYFITFDNGIALEIMQRTDITASFPDNRIGFTHIAFSVCSKEAVDHLIDKFSEAGLSIPSTPRFTGDGFYEGSVLDPDGNLIEIVAHKEVEIKPATSYPYPLLLLADPEQEKVDGYLKNSDCFVATLNGQTVGVIVVQKQSEKTAEIMNLAVDESFQRRGIARKLLRYITNQWAATAYITRLIIRTGTSAPGPFMLYQQEGFDLKNVEYNYFVHHYKEPIFENGVQCRHQLIMEKVIPDPTETF